MTQALDRILNKAKIGLMSTNNSVFLSTILFSLKQQWDRTITTANTDGSDLNINPEWFDGLTPKARIGLLAHEAWHVAFQHMSRGKNYEHERYNKAADYVINLMLREAGYELPPKGLIDYHYRDMSTEQVYALLPEEPAGGSGYDCDIKAPTDDPSNDKNGKTIADKEMEIASIVIKASTQAKMQGEKPGSMPSEIAVALDELINPVLPWNILLQNYMSQFAKEDYSYKRPNKRYMPDFYLPSQHSEALADIAVAVDTSGSVTDEEFAAFISEIESIRETLNPHNITIVDFDSSVKKVHKLSRDMPIADVKFTGRGGTRLQPVFSLFEKNIPTVLIVFSDLWCTKIDKDPGYPVIWIAVNNTAATANFGELIHYNV